MSEDKTINLSEGLEAPKNVSAVFGLEKQGTAQEVFEEMNRENMSKLIERTADVLNLVQGEKENLHEEMPEPTVESKPVEEKVNNFIARTEEKIIELRDLESKLDSLLVEFGPDMPGKIVKEELPKEEITISDFEEIRSKGTKKFDVDAVKVDAEKKETTQLKDEIAEAKLKKIFFKKITETEQVVEKADIAVVGEKEGVTFPIFRDIVAHPKHLENYGGRIKGIKKMIERHGGDAGALSETEQRLASWLIYKHDLGDIKTKVSDIIQIRQPDTARVVFEGNKFVIIPVDKKAVENNLFIKSDDKDKPTHPPEETIPILAAESRYEKVWEEVKNKLLGNLRTDKTTSFVLSGSGGESKEFILNIIQKVSDTAYLDLTNKKLVELLSNESATAGTEISKAVEDEIFGVLPKEADVLLEPSVSGDGAVVLEGGSNAIKFVDPNTGKGFFTYSPEYTFYQNDAGNLIAKKAGVEYSIKPLFEAGELKVVFEEIIKEKKA